MELLLSFIHLLKTQGEVSQTELLKKSGANSNAIKRFSQIKIFYLLKSAMLTESGVFQKNRISVLN